MSFFATDQPKNAGHAASSLWPSIGCCSRASVDQHEAAESVQACWHTDSILFAELTALVHTSLDATGKWIDTPESVGTRSSNKSATGRQMSAKWRRQSTERQFSMSNVQHPRSNRCLQHRPFQEVWQVEGQPTTGRGATHHSRDSINPMLIIMFLRACSCFS